MAKQIIKTTESFIKKTTDVRIKGAGAGIVTNIDKTLITAIGRLQKDFPSVQKEIVNVYKKELQDIYSYRKDIMSKEGKPTPSEITKLKKNDRRASNIRDEFVSKGLLGKGSGYGTFLDLDTGERIDDAVRYSRQRVNAFGSDDKYANYRTVKEVVDRNGGLDDFVEGSEGSLLRLLTSYGLTVKKYRSFEKKEAKIRKGEQNGEQV